MRYVNLLPLRERDSLIAALPRATTTPVLNAILRATDILGAFVTATGRTTPLRTDKRKMDLKNRKDVDID